jgi:hypothetical protein
MPLERLFEYCGEQMALYYGKDLGDLIVITLNKYVRPPLLAHLDTELISGNIALSKRL